MDQSQTPLLSVIVVIVSDTTDGRCDLAHLSACLSELNLQIDSPAMEIIVPYQGGVTGLDELARRFPDVLFQRVDDLKTYKPGGGSREHHDELRARGLASARGGLIALLEDHARPDRHWARQMTLAHEQQFAGVGGAIENGVNRPLNWAVYFCDFGKYQNPLTFGESPIASDANVSYKRSALVRIRSTWEAIFHETAVNWALHSHGERLALCPNAIVHQHRSDLRFWPALTERFIWGKSYAAGRCQLLGMGKRTVLGVLSVCLPFILVLRMSRTVIKKGRCLGAFVKALPWTIVLVTSWSLGEFVGYWTAPRKSSG